jgi:hypothetical protein
VPRDAGAVAELQFWGAEKCLHVHPVATDARMMPAQKWQLRHL